MKIAEVAPFQGKSLWIVAGKESSVHDDAANDSRQAEPDDAPIVAGGAAAARFPTVHPFSTRGVFSFDENGIGFLEKVFFGSKKVVVGFEHTPAEAFGGEIGELREVFHRLPRRRTCPAGMAQKFPRSKIFIPRRKVASTIPRRSRPA